jgi:hypothetical protein
MGKNAVLCFLRRRMAKNVKRKVKIVLALVVGNIG